MSKGIPTIETLGSAMEAVWRNKLRSFLTTLGIVIGVASVIMLVSIGNGLQKFVTKQFEGLGANLVLVAPGRINVKSGPSRPVPLTPKFTWEDIRGLERTGEPIVAVSGTTYKSGTGKYEGKTWDVSVTGVDEKYSELRNIRAQTGEFITKNMVERSQAVVVLGPTVAKNLFGVESPLDKQIDVLGRKLTVVGVTESKGGGFGGNTDQDSFVYIPVTTAQKITGDKHPATIMVKAQSPETTPIVTEKIKSYFYKRKLTDDDFTVLEPKEILASITSFLGAVTAALGGIAAISLLVGGIGIANIMLVSVTERTREIGLRKSLGATKRDIMWQFLAEAAMLSALGGVIGIGIGGGVSLLLRRFIETEVTWPSVVMAFGVSAVVGVVAGLAPAVRAAKLDPITALRYE